MFVRRIIARVRRSRLVVGPCIACSLRSGVTLALAILMFAPLSMVTQQQLPVVKCIAVFTSYTVRFFCESVRLVSMPNLTRSHPDCKVLPA